MAIIKEKEKKKVVKILADLKNPVKLIMFTQEFECESCKVARDLLTELSRLSDKLSLEFRDFAEDKELVEKYGVDKIPALIVEGDRDYGIKYYGVPSGYEFAALLQDILDVGRRDPNLPEDIKEHLAQVDQPVHLQVMTTALCPFCPVMVRLAHKFAMASDLIKADQVEISHFPTIAVKYNVQGVPVLVINEKLVLPGVHPDIEIAHRILEVIGKEEATPVVPAPAEGQPEQALTPVANPAAPQAGGPDPVQS